RFWGGPMRSFRIDSSGWPSPDFSPSSAHYDRHRLSRRAFIGGAAAATGVTVGSGLLWPAAGSAVARRNRTPKPTTATFKAGAQTFPSPPVAPGEESPSITPLSGFRG